MLLQTLHSEVLHNSCSVLLCHQFETHTMKLSWGWEVTRVVVGLTQTYQSLPSVTWPTCIMNSDLQKSTKRDDDNISTHFSLALASLQHIKGWEMFWLGWLFCESAWNGSRPSVFSFLLWCISEWNGFSNRKNVARALILYIVNWLSLDRFYLL